MKEYLQLSRIYHDMKLRDHYQEIYENRVNGEGTFQLPLTIKDTTTGEEMPLFVVITPQIYIITHEIYKKLEELNLLVHQLPQAAIRDHIMNVTIIDELIQTNAIEGIHSSRKDILDAIDATKRKTKKNQKIRFQNQVIQYLNILKKEKFKLSTAEDLRQLYDAFLVDEIEDVSLLPDGKIFRKNAVEVISETGRVLHNGLMPEDEIIKAINKLLFFIEDENYPILLKVALGHYYFGYIHPFYDGNGRVSRLISSYLLAEHFCSLVALRLSIVIHEDIKQYHKAFDTVNNRLNKGDATIFYKIFLDIIKRALDELVEDLDNKYAILCYTEEKINTLEGLTYEEQQTLFIMQQAKLFSDKDLTIAELMRNMGLKRGRMQTILDSLEKKAFISVYRAGKVYQYVLLNEFLE